MTQTATPRDVLRDVFGFPEFRAGQEAVVSRLLEGRPVLAIFPTGAGKSLCYQLPALLLDGVTLVISPLIALMKDQIDFLVGKGVAAARIDSSLSTEEWRGIMRELRGGRLKLLYVAPERLGNERFLQTLRSLRLSMLAVDEAHCISEWGHNFRPDYMKIAAMAKDLGVGRVLALTATATPSVARDIAGGFAIAPGDIVQTGFYRPNLHIHITPVEGPDRDGVLLERIRSRPRGPGIVYVTLQRTAEQVAAHLEREGLPAKAYHAGMDAEQRHAVQDWFMQSADAIVVATIAFGMGIDKRDIRAVYHYNLPKSLENYAQEIGRAGRDGLPSTCEMLASSDDVTVLENFTYGDTPTPHAVAGVVHHCLDRREERFDISTYELSGEFDVRPLVIETLLTYLELDGLIASTGPFYAEYRFQPQRSSAQILAQFDARRQAFLKRVLGQAQKAQTWFRLNIDAAARAAGEPREKVVAAMTYLEEQGELLLKVEGVRHGYRILRSDVDLARLTTSLVERFQHRERRDIERLGQVLEFANHRGCFTNHLLAYFGEARDAPCGHCSACRGHANPGLPPARTVSLGERAAAVVRELRAEEHAALSDARQIARFLCGITSPAASRAKLAKHERFGAWAEVPFNAVLAFVERTVGA